LDEQHSFAEEQAYFRSTSDKPASRRGPIPVVTT
jgi:hypothetical protein